MYRIHELLHRGCDATATIDFHVKSIENKVPLVNESSNLEPLLNAILELTNLPSLATDEEIADYFGKKYFRATVESLNEELGKSRNYLELLRI